MALKYRKENGLINTNFTHFREFFHFFGPTFCKYINNCTLRSNSSSINNLIQLKLIEEYNY